MTESNTVDVDENETCFFCGVSSSDEVTLQNCEHCKLVWYCGVRHQKLHRPKNICYPIKVARHPTKGIVCVN